MACRPSTIRVDGLHERGANAGPGTGLRGGQALGHWRLRDLAGSPRGRGTSDSSSPSVRTILSRSPNSAPRACCGRTCWRPSGSRIRRPAPCTLPPLRRAATRASATAIPTCCASPPRRSRPWWAAATASPWSHSVSIRTSPLTCSASLKRKLTWIRWPTPPAVLITSNRSPPRWPAKPGSCSSRSRPRADSCSRRRPAMLDRALDESRAVREKAVSSRRRPW